MKIAFIGATGLVGREILKIIHEKKLDKGNEIYLYASNKSDGLLVAYRKNKYKVRELKKDNLESFYDFALFSAGSSVSKVWASEFVSRGAIVIDNSSAFRRNNNIPLIVPEINLKAVKDSKIIANPNCSTIGASLPIYAMSDLYSIKRIIISTYQAVSGAGQAGVNDLANKTKTKFLYQICNNLIPQIDKPLKNGYSFEEDKMEFELKKILNNQLLKVSATCVRVPITNCHSESVFVEFKNKPNLQNIINRLKKTEGVTVVNDLERSIYPMPLNANGKNDVFVGRIRCDTSTKNAISFFISFDNIRKGAALNAVQIMEKIIKNEKNYKKLP